MWAHLQSLVTPIGVRSHDAAPCCNVPFKSLLLIEAKIETLYCRVLDLEECRGIGADSLGYALTGLPKLRVLNLSGNPEVSDALLSETALAAPLCEVSLCR